MYSRLIFKLKIINAKHILRLKIIIYLAAGTFAQFSPRFILSNCV